MDIHALLAEAAKYLAVEIEKDGKNRYSLKKDWTLPLVNIHLPDYEDDAFRIIPLGDGKTEITVKAFASTEKDAHCDGCSLSPDKIGNLDFVPGAIFHDRWYEDLEKLAEGMRLPVKDVRKVGDKIFASLMIAHNDGRPFRRTLATVYYWGVRLFGGIYHGRGDKINKALGKAAKNVAKVLIIVGLSAAFWGCSGCVQSILDGDGYEPPEVEKVAMMQ